MSTMAAAKAITDGFDEILLTSLITDLRKQRGCTMSGHLFKSLRCCAVAVCTIAFAIEAEAVTKTVQRNINNNNLNSNTDGNRPWFVDNYTSGGATYTNPEGYFGSVLPGTSNTTTVVNPDVGIGGDGTNGIPMGVGFNFGISFNVSITGPGDPTGLKLTDGGSDGVGVDSTTVQGDTQTLRLNSNEQLLFSDIQVTNVSVQDPLHLLQAMPLEQAVNNVFWNVLRSNDFSGIGDAAMITDADTMQVIRSFSGGNPTATPPIPSDIQNNFDIGTFTPTSSVILTTTAGNWRLKGIGFQADLNYELAPVPASRRTFMFGDSLTTPVYDNLTTHQITANDSTMTINAVGNGAVFDTNDLGAGINSAEDDALGDAGQRRIDGTLPTPEAIQVSFNKDVSLESITLGSYNLSGLEGMRLAFVSGTNPFANPLTGYSSGYVFDATSVTFSTSAGGQTPFLIPFGIEGQDQIIIEAGTVLSLTANPAHTDGGILLDMITVHLLETLGVPGDYNSNGTVDAADYVLWRKGGSLANEIDTPGTVNDADYTEWRARFGNGGGGSGLASAVPEPCSWVLLMSVLMMGACRARFGR
jgi:hypothetical protein